jgi:hypothetical protein
VHVPHAGDKPLASPWMAKHATRVRGHAGNPNSSVALDKEVRDRHELLSLLSGY